MLTANEFKMTVNDYSHEKMATGNFDFLRYEFIELYQQAVQAEKYLYSDSQASLAKMRLFVELACHELGKYLRLRPPVHGELRNKINMLETSGKVEPWVIDVMHTLRDAGNRSVHLTEINGHFVAKLSVSASRMENLMRDLHDVAKYLASKLGGSEVASTSEWIKPAESALSELVEQALSGQRDASYALAEYFYEQLASKVETGADKWWSKTIYADWQRDLAYWLEKAHSQGQPQSWLLLAKSYASGKLPETSARDAKMCFKKALEHDDDGQAALAFGLYLQQNSEQTRGWQLIEQAADKGLHEALCCLQKRDSQRDKSRYLTWLAKGLEVNQVAAFTLDAFEKLQSLRQTPECEGAVKALRSAVITAVAKRAPGIEFIVAIQQGNGWGNKELSPDEMVKQMVASYSDLPDCIFYQRELFDAVCATQGHYDELRKIYRYVASIAASGDDLAQVQFSMAMKAIEAFKQNRNVAIPEPLHLLLQQSADAGHSEARAYINSSEGKALLKKTGFVTGGRMRTKSAEEKAKAKNKRKLAQKSRRK